MCYLRNYLAKLSFDINFSYSLSLSSNCQPNDLERTAGISVDYIQTCDFDLSEGDKQFLIQVNTESIK